MFERPAIVDPAPFLNQILEKMDPLPETVRKVVFISEKTKIVSSYSFFKPNLPKAAMFREVMHFFKSTLLEWNEGLLGDFH